jgi:hypothetical protein
MKETPTMMQAEPVSVNVLGAQEFIPTGWKSIPGLLKKAYNYELWIKGVNGRGLVAPAHIRVQRF